MTDLSPEQRIETLRYLAKLVKGDEESDVPYTLLEWAADEIERLRIWQREGRAWLAACLGYVTGSGPPNWDGIRAFLAVEQKAPERAVRRGCSYLNVPGICPTCGAPEGEECRASFGSW